MSGIASSDRIGSVGQVRPRAGEALVVAIDTLVEGVHFRQQARPEDLAWKSVAVNLSDLAAMGASATAVALSLSVNNRNHGWLTRFHRGLEGVTQAFNVEMIAATVTEGHTVVTVEAYGSIPPGHALLRSGARAGDEIWVTGTLGDAGLGLEITQGRRRLPPPDAEYLLGRLDRPTPRLDAGRALRNVASAAIDVSDGLAGDLQHILERSRVGATIEVDALPISPALRRELDDENAWHMALSAGDDYELCFTVPPTRRGSLESELAKIGVPISRIGEIERLPGLRFQRTDGENFAARAAFKHFS